MRRRTDEGGFSLIEASVATALVAGVLMMAARWVVDGSEAGFRSTIGSVAAVLASHKLEQLRALRWTVDDLGVRRADLQADTSVDPPAGSGGLGLSLSPPGTLESDTPGYVDYLSPDARAVPALAGAAYVRRWAIAPLTLVGGDGVLMEVCVLPARTAVSITAADVRRHPDSVCAASARVRGVR